MKKAGSNSDLEHGSYHSILKVMEADLLTDSDAGLEAVKMTFQLLLVYWYWSVFEIDMTPLTASNDTA